MAAMRDFTAFCTFSKARTSIWRTRSRDTPNSSASSSSVTGSSARRRASKMRRSRSLSTSSADDSALRRLSSSSCAALADRRVERRVAAKPAVHVDDILLGDAETLGDDLHLIGAKIALLQRGDLALRLAQVEEQLLLVRGGAHF